MTDMERVMQGVIPYLMVDGADKAIAFYEKAFGAKDLGTMRSEDGKHVMHSQLEINGGALMLSDAAVMGGKQEFRKLHDAACDPRRRQVVEARGRCGLRGGGAVCDAVLGRPLGKLRDPFGHQLGAA